MVSYAPNMADQRFGRIYVVKRVPGQKNGCALWLCECDCGKELILRGAVIRRAVRNGKVASCGCWAAEIRLKKATKHGLSNSKVYRSWHGIFQRCDNPKCEAYKNYGGRGIKYCDRWKSFEKFLQDMGHPPPANHEIDRIDTNGNYEPSNCRWATIFENSLNRRDSILWFVNGVRYEAATLAAKAHNVNPTTIHVWCGRKKGASAKPNCWTENRYK